MSKEVAEEYLSSLADLTVNSKPLINMLTMLADENVDHAPAIVQVIESHLEKVPPEVKLPILYLIDSIIKNVSKVYVPLFTQNIVNIFVSVFEKVDERTRLNMYKLRQTWADVFPARKLYVLDLRVKDIDHAWPVTAPTPTSIHFNPKFLGNKSSSNEVSSETNIPPQTPVPSTTTVQPESSDLSESLLRDQLLKKQKILIELQQKKLELQLMQTKAIIGGQENQLKEPVLSNLVRPPINEEAVKLLSQRAGVKPKAVVMPPSTVSGSKLGSTNNSTQSKTRIAPVNTQLIEAVKSRDPRIARQQQQNKTSSEISHKEQEIYNRQLAMLKTPIVEQIAPVATAQKVLSDCNVKSHITFNVQGNMEKEKTIAKNKRQIKESLKSEIIPNDKSRLVYSKDFKSTALKSSKNLPSKDSNIPSLKDSQHQNILDKSKIHKNEQSASQGTVRNSSRDSSKWCKDSNNRRSRSHSSKTSPKKSSNRSPRNSPKNDQSKEDYSPKSHNSSVSESASIPADEFKKTYKKSKKKHKKDDNKNFDSVCNRESADNSSKKKGISNLHKEDVNLCNLENKDKLPVNTFFQSEPTITDKVPKFSENGRNSEDNSETGVKVESVQKTLTNSDCIKNLSEKSEVNICEEKEISSEKYQKHVKKLVLLDLELIESSPSPEPPPPPIISRPDEESICEKKDDLEFEEASEDEKDSKKEITGFKDMKGVLKGRNYIRRNRELSISPSKEVSVTSRELSTSPSKDIVGDVDLRVCGPPEKQARLLYEEEKSNDIESKKLLSESLVNVSGKDVDLRLLSIRGTSPNKKRLSTEAAVEEPPKKKNKSEIFDELFGSEDVDLRKMTTLAPGERLPSPPPPPVISNGPTTPQVATIAPLVVGEAVKQIIADSNSKEFLREDDEDMSRDREDFEFIRNRYRKSWADLKNKPGAEIKPLGLNTPLDLEIGQKDISYPTFDSPEKCVKKHPRDRASPRGEFDRLGRPLLYNKLPNDPRARRESLGVLDGRDTDMRRIGNLIHRDSETNINVNMIVAQAADQVRNGTMSSEEYNEILKQVIHVNEKQKLREAQNKSRQEMRRSQFHPRNRHSPNRYGPQNRNSPPYRLDDDRRDRRPFNDIDERLQMPWRNMQHTDSAPGFNRIQYPCSSNRIPFDISEYDERTVKNDVWEDDTKRFRRFDEFENSENRPRDVMCNERTHDCVDVPPADSKILEIIGKDPMKSINIDGTARDIRFYGDTAVVMLSWEDPKEISFEDGIRRVMIGELSIVCALNNPYIIFMLNGNTHRIRLGAPTRELYIDGEFYEAHFGGPPVQVQIDGLPYLVQVEGPPPQVKIGRKRTDLVCGRINMIVDASDMLPLYLDAKPQRFDLRSRPYIFRFVNSLKTLLVNDVPVDIQFGGGCRQICGYGNLHFLRLSGLPNGVEPGVVQITNMENLGLPPLTNIMDSALTSGKSSPPQKNIQQIGVSSEINSVNLGLDVTQHQYKGGGPLDILTSLMSGATAPQQAVGFNYQVESKDTGQITQSSNRPETEVQTSHTQTSTLPLLGSGLNINDLFQRLVASGIVPTLSNSSETKQKAPTEPQVKPIDFTDANSLRERQPPIINSLYSGIQCSSCGVRFSPEETLKYSRHLDWHFRQNRRDKDAARKGQSRKWYYDVSDWIQFEEIEDLEERAQSWFETEATSNVEENIEHEEIKSVPAPSGHGSTLCELCRDEFETYYNEDKEEWHLKPCILIEGKYYHPFCYDDLMNIPEDSSLLGEKTIVSAKDESTIENHEGFKEMEEDITESKVQLDISEVISDKNSEDCVELKMETYEQHTENLEENSEEIVKTLLNELINCIVFKNEIKFEEELAEESKSNHEDEIEVLESVPVEQKKNIIDVDLIEKLDDEDDIIYQRKTPSPIILIPPAKIKQEPVDEMESPVAIVDQTYTNVVSSIDGNVEMIDAPQVAPSGPSRIKITFNKPMPLEQHSEKQIIKVPESGVEENDPDPLPLKPKKPRIAERDMTVCLPCVRGTEVSGLCSIM